MDAWSRHDCRRRRLECYQPREGFALVFRLGSQNLDAKEPVLDNGEHGTTALCSMHRAQAMTGSARLRDGAGRHRTATGRPRTRFVRRICVAAVGSGVPRHRRSALRRASQGDTCTEGPAPFRHTNPAANRRRRDARLDGASAAGRRFRTTGGRHSSWRVPGSTIYRRMQRIGIGGSAIHGWNAWTFALRETVRALPAWSGRPG